MADTTFIVIKVTLEMRLYNGRLLDDLKDPENYHVMIFDQFSEILLDGEELRDGEYIKLLDVEKLNPNP